MVGLRENSFLTTALNVKAENSEMSNEFVISHVNFELRMILGICFFLFYIYAKAGGNLVQLHPTSFVSIMKQISKLMLLSKLRQS